MRPDDAIALWDGETLELGHGLTLIRAGGHFPGGTVLHREEQAGALLTGDIIQVIPDRTHVAFMWSYPNQIPLPDEEVQGIGAAVEPFAYETIYGAWWGTVIPTGARADRAPLGRALRRGPARRVAAVTEAVRALLQETRTWAVVGCSPDPRRDSHRVAAFLQRAGFRIIPVNPNHTGELLGERCYPDLHAIPEPIEVVDIFRRATAAGHHVDEAIALNATGVWLQLGVIDHARRRPGASRRAEGRHGPLPRHRAPQAPLRRFTASRRQ